MGFRAAWLEHERLLSVHSEDFLHLMDRVVQHKPVNLLLLGVGNGGSVQVWRKVLPEGSVVTALDSHPEADSLGLDAVFVDLENEKALRDALSGSWFNVIIDSTGSFMPTAWPFLQTGGILIVENCQQNILMDLVLGLATDKDSPLPTEEIMSLMIFNSVACIEKRNPRVVPYLKIITGKDDPLIAESFYYERGAKRLSPNSQTVPK